MAATFFSFRYAASDYSEFGSERIPRGLLRCKRVNAERLFPKNRRFSAACCGELQYVLIVNRERYAAFSALRIIWKEFYLAASART
jgi:hypothetical protein